MKLFIVIIVIFLIVLSILCIRDLKWDSIRIILMLWGCLAAMTYFNFTSFPQRIKSGGSLGDVKNSDSLGDVKSMESVFSQCITPANYICTSSVLNMANMFKLCADSTHKIDGGIAPW